MSKKNLLNTLKSAVQNVFNPSQPFDLIERERTSDTTPEHGWQNRRKEVIDPVPTIKIKDQEHVGGVFVTENVDRETLLMLEKNPKAIWHIKNPHEDAQFAAVHYDDKAIAYIRNPTENLLIHAITQKPSSLFLLKDRPSDAILIKCMDVYPRVFNYIKNPSEEIVDIALKTDGYLIASVQNPTKENFKQAIETNPAVITHLTISQYIDSDESLQLDLVTKDRDNFNKIKNPANDLMEKSGWIIHSPGTDYDYEKLPDVISLLPIENFEIKLTPEGKKQLLDRTCRNFEYNEIQKMFDGDQVGDKNLVLNKDGTMDYIKYKVNIEGTSVSTETRIIPINLSQCTFKEIEVEPKIPGSNFEFNQKSDFLKGFNHDHDQGIGM